MSSEVSDLAIGAAGIGKRYRITHLNVGIDRVTESLSATLHAPIRRMRGGKREVAEWIWALREVSFEIPRGEVVGVIGRNGAGKSTLLKVLSRITEPTVGQAFLRGRVATLLEVGTGFHLELSGRENIFLSGAVLGMRRNEIVRKFDEIVAFAGLEKFLDTPVKRYSSGMQVRLGFAVAAHLEPEILLVDEVLAVGDAEFQAKSLGRLEEIGSTGRTVIFVSHSMPAMLRLCSRALLLDRGRVVTDGNTADVVRAYLETDLGRTSERRWASSDEAPGDTVARLMSIRVLTGGHSGEEVDIRQPVDVEVVYESREPGNLRPFANLHFFNDAGVCLFVTSDSNDREWSRSPRKPGVVRSTAHIPGNFFAEGRVIVTAAVSTMNPTAVHALERDAVAFQVVDRSIGDAARGEWAEDVPGVVRPMLEWTVASNDA